MKPAVALLGLLLSCIAYAETEKSPRVQHITFIAPASLDELWSSADVVAQVRIVGGKPELRTGQSDPKARYVFTTHRTKVVDVLKSIVSSECARLSQDITDCSPRAGAELTLQQSAGEAESEGEIVRIADEIPLRAGAEYIVFLRWDPYWKAFIPTHGPHSTFEIRNGVVHPTSAWRVSKEQEGKPAAKFAEELRRKGGLR
ncbi:MAG TPA: hypothetical protein VHK90_02175 [Thermoanaerobaculia bacterium]|nr:hypothetical protein [Thermoanaerobaculia bacterium]